MWFSAQKEKIKNGTFDGLVQFACVESSVWCKDNKEGKCCLNCPKRTSCEKCCGTVKSGEEKYCDALVPREVLQVAFTNLTELCNESNIPLLYEYFRSICINVEKSIAKLIEE
jgi:hypothetical protein